jgi:hypothetical protein
MVSVLGFNGNYAGIVPEFAPSPTSQNQIRKICQRGRATFQGLSRIDKEFQGATTVGYLVSAMLAVVGVIHLLPLSGVLGSERLSMLYGLPFAEPNLVILMRHRAVLFGLLGLLMLVAALRPSLQPVAFIAGFVSVTSFLWLAWSVDGYNMQTARVVTVDLVALACLVVGVAAYICVRRAE